ncbi:hypothetical protein GGF32_007377, partial [Allomyces javanicus]
MPSRGKIANVNPKVIRAPGVTLSIQDGDGFGGLGESDIEITDMNLQQLKDRPAVLLLVAEAGRTPSLLINHLKLLKIVSDIGDHNCFLVLTKTRMARKFGNRNGASWNYDPTSYLATLDEAKVGYFKLGHNVVCTDFEHVDYTRHLDEIRAGLCKLRPLNVCWTFTGAKDVAKRKQVHLDREIRRITDVIEAKRSEISRCQLYKAAIIAGSVALAGAAIHAGVLTSDPEFAEATAGFGAAKIVQTSYESQDKRISVLKDEIRQLETER